MTKQMLVLNIQFYPMKKDILSCQHTLSLLKKNVNSILV